MKYPKIWDRMVMDCGYRTGGMWTVRIVLLLICFATGLFSPARAQVLYGTLTGNVTDATGAVIPQATVKAVNVETGFNRTTQSNQEGIYKFSDLTPGTYTVTINMAGYGEFTQSGTPILVNTVQRVDAALQIGKIEQSVTVTGAAPTLQTDRADTNFTLETEQIAALPTTSTEGRNFQSLLKIIPGSSPPAESNSAAGNPQRAQVFNVNGITNTTNTTRIDGAIDAYPVLPSLVAYLPPTDGIASINIVTGSFNAEQGSAGGAAVNVTIKSGTNQLHGSVWEYNSIAQFDAQAWQNRSGVRQKNLLNEYGLSIGGPILKDKLFFFADWDHVKTSKIAVAALNVDTIPTQVVGQGGINAAGGADFSTSGSTIYDPLTGLPFPANVIPANRIAPAATTLLALLPKPNIPGTGNGTVNNYSALPTTIFTRDNIDSKITYNPTTKTGFFGHYSLSPDTISDPQLLDINGGSAGGLPVDGGQPGTATGLIQNVGLNTTHLFTPNVLLDADFGFTRQRVADRADDVSKGDYGTQVLGVPGTNNNGQSDYAGIPGFFFSTNYASLGNAMTSNPFKYRDNQETGNVNLSYSHGKHAYRFGSEYLHAALNHLQPGSLASAPSTPRGGFQFTGAVTSLQYLPGTTTAAPTPTQFNDLADFLLGLPHVEGKQIQLFNPLAFRFSEFAFFAQDTWQATANLTVNYGIRYEYYPLPVANHYGLLRYDPTVQTQITDINGTHNVGDVLVGGQGTTPSGAGINNHRGMVVPRIGISYRVAARTVVRGGFGITVDPENLRSLLTTYPQALGLSQTAAGTHGSAAAEASLNAPSATYTPGIANLQVGIPAINTATPQAQLATGSVPLPSNFSTYTVPKDFRRGYIESFNVAVQHEFPKQMTSTVSYVGSHAVRQQSLYDINGAPVGGTTPNRFLNAQYGANFSNADIYEILPFQGSVYNSLQTQLTSTGSRSYQYGVVYTYSKVEDAADNGQLGTLLFVDPNQISRNYALAGYDRTHNFEFWSILKSPIDKHKTVFGSKMLGLVAGGWQLTDILSRVSGTPFNVTATAGTGFGNAFGNTQVADYLPGNSKVLGAKTNGFRQYLNPAAYAAVPSAAVRFGTSGRDGVRGPGFFNLDTSLARSFPLFREAELEFQADAFNITNTPQFANPGANVSSPSSFGVITTSNSNRTMRLSARITF